MWFLRPFRKPTARSRTALQSFYERCHPLAICLSVVSAPSYISRLKILTKLFLRRMPILHRAVWYRNHS